MSYPREVRNLRTRLIERFRPLISTDDENRSSEKEEERVFLSRAIAALAVKSETACSDLDAAASIIDGRNDWGIDAIDVEEQGDRHHIRLIQAKWDKDANAGFGQSDVDKMLRGYDYLMGLEFTKFNKRIEAHIPALERALDSASPKITLVLALVTSTDLHPDIQELLKAELKERNWAEENVSHKVLDLRDLYREILGDHADRKIDLEAWVEGVGREEHPYTAYYGTLAASEVADWYDAHGRHLFARNIRDSLDSSDVNDKIRGTLLQEPEHFWYFSNGITLLCDRIRKKGAGDFRPNARAGFVLEGASIVNGAQTVSAMHRAMQRNADSAALGRVLVRIISLENCPDGFGDRVTLSTNTQNPIEERDWKSRDPIQIALRDDFAISLGRTYVVKRGEPEPAPDSGCTMTEAAVALAALHKSPEMAARAKRDPSLLWEKENYEKIFGRKPEDAPGAHRVWRSIQLVRAVQAALTEQSNSLFGRAASAASNGDLLISHVVFQNLDTTDIDKEAADSDWNSRLAQVPELVERTLGWLVRTVNNAYGRNSQMLTTMRTPERVRLVSRRVLEAMGSGKPAPDNADYRVEERIQDKQARLTNSVSLILTAERIRAGQVLEFRPVTRPDRQGLAAWLAANPRRTRATWRSHPTKPLVWAADGESYAPSTLVRKMRREAMGNNQQVQGTLYWHVPGEGSLVDIAGELRAKEDLDAGKPLAAWERELLEDERHRLEW
ncbi:AIPR family protein [Streptomyces sp. NPDC091299]|uniref:AIPR family protein n=1 Tax=Streptomyces sp. NPDC091299 TaxID=3155302 RepID=UPI003448ABFE